MNYLEQAHDECPQHPYPSTSVSPIAYAVRALEIEDGWRGITVIPARYDSATKAVGEVRLATPAESRLLPESVEWFEGEAGPEHDGDLDLFHHFEPAEHLLACHWQFWLDGFLTDGKPFVIGLTEIRSVNDDDPDAYDEPVGWALMGRVL